MCKKKRVLLPLTLNVLTRVRTRYYMGLLKRRNKNFIQAYSLLSLIPRIAFFTPYVTVLQIK